MNILDAMDLSRKHGEDRIRKAVEAEEVLVKGIGDFYQALAVIANVNPVFKSNVIGLALSNGTTYPKYQVGKFGAVDDLERIIKRAESVIKAINSHRRLIKPIEKDLIELE
jgi:hypothetical protein